MTETVTQADLDAAAALLDQQAIRFHSDGTFRDWDNTTQAFANHRAQAERDTADAMREALVEFVEAAECAAGCVDNTPLSEAYSEIMSSMGSAMAAAYDKARKALGGQP